MNIEMVNVEGEPKAYHIKLNVLRRIILAGHQKLDGELVDTIEFIKTAEDAEEYDAVLEILEGAYIEGKLVIQAAKEAEKLLFWIDSLPEQEAQWITEHH
jgi:hypothetical protein